MRYLLLLTLISISLSAEAQRFRARNNQNAKFQPETYYYGFKGGANYGTLDGVKTTIIRPFFPVESFATESAGQIGYSGGIFFYYRFPASSLAIQPEIIYGQQGGSFKYNDIDDLQYRIDFNYEYLHLATFLKLYPFSRENGGLHLAAGPRLSLNMANDKITYWSNTPDIGPDLQIQQNLRDVLKGENLFAVGFGLGFDFSFGLSLEARYYIGISDAIETQANGYNFIENDNRSRVMEVSLGYAIPFVTY